MDYLKLSIYMDILMICFLVAHAYSIVADLILLQQVSIISLIGVSVCYYQITRMNKVYPELKEKWMNDLRK